MNPFRVDFGCMPWQEAREGVRQKVHCDGSHVVRLVQFDTEDVPDQWCDAGHIGYVLEGSLQISFNGEVHAFRKGDALIIPAGAAARHRATQITAGTRLLMIEENGTPAT